MDSATLSLAIVAGVLATFNPCGFALLPAYMGVIATANEGRSTSQALAGGLRFASGMTVGFVLLFGTFGVVFAPFASAISRYLPIVTIIVGLSIVALGGWLLLGRKVGKGTGVIQGWSPGERWASYIGYGLTFAIVSLSCTLGPFLAVTGASIRSREFFDIVATFVAFALGMGAAVGVLAVTTALTGSHVSVWMRSKSDVVSRMTGSLVILAGFYVAWFGWFEWRINSGERTDDPIIAAVASIQSWVINSLSSHAELVTSLVGLIVMAAVAGILFLNKR
ncbi:MAG: cytochrome c biogenesis protein CcdA [Actinobacteria bacterium]|nr:cytochrome c biogenesis protein CcdA [Actinomycetota bacterium]